MGFRAGSADITHLPSGRLVDHPRSPKKGGVREKWRGGEEREGEEWRERDKRGGGGGSTIYSDLLACVIHILHHRFVHNFWRK